LDFNVINDKTIPTGGNNTLDITLANNKAFKFIVKHSVMPKLNSDHNPTETHICLENNPYEENGDGSNRNTRVEYTVMDMQKTIKNLKQAITQTDDTKVTLEEINEILKNSVEYKKIQHKPIKFWTPQLKKAVRLQNKARKAIQRARRLGQDTKRTHNEYLLAQNEFRKIFKKAKRDYNTQQVQRACADPTGAELYKIIKELEPKLNRKAQPTSSNNQQPDIESEEIAQKFELIFGQSDVEPTKAEKVALENNLKVLEYKILNEPPDKLRFTIRELRQAIKKANMKSSKGPDGVSNKLIKIACDSDNFSERPC